MCWQWVQGPEKRAEEVIDTIGLGDWAELGRNGDNTGSGGSWGTVRAKGLEVSVVITRCQSGILQVLDRWRRPVIRSDLWYLRLKWAVDTFMMSCMEVKSRSGIPHGSSSWCREQQEQGQVSRREILELTLPILSYKQFWRTIGNSSKQRI